MRQITIEQAMSQDAESYLGTLHLAYINWKDEAKKAAGQGKKFDKCQPEHSLSTAQYYALLSCQEAHNDYLKAIGAPGAYYDGHNGSTGDEGAHKEWVRMAKARWTGEGGIRDAIREAQQCDRSSNLWAALDFAVIRKERVPYLLGSVKALANVLNRHFSKGKKQR
ncbi:hypothetical protein [Nitratireductor sp. CH_MIT9313-5]|uniref:hypothetical protein n=1 Tax=Nitratireductor sp. CH_MIT9313-5 TaxID=3107764 RepID=UPI003008AD64